MTQPSIPQPNLNALPNYAQGAPFIPFVNFEGRLLLCHAQAMPLPSGLGLGSYNIEVICEESNNPLVKVGEKYTVYFGFKGDEKKNMAMLGKATRFFQAAHPSHPHDDPNGVRDFLLSAGPQLQELGMRVRIVQGPRAGKNKDGSPMKNPDGTQKYFTEAKYYPAA